MHASKSVSVLAVTGAVGFVVKTGRAIDHAPEKLIDISNAAKALETTHAIEIRASITVRFIVDRAVIKAWVLQSSPTRAASLAERPHPTTP